MTIVLVFTLTFGVPTLTGATVCYFVVAHGNATRWVPRWRRMARDNREAAAREPSHIIECRLLAEQCRESGQLTSCGTRTITASMTEVADGAVRRQQRSLERADQLDREADRMWTWPFTVREEADS